MDEYFDVQSYMLGFEYEPPEPTEEDFEIDEYELYDFEMEEYDCEERLMEEYMLDDYCEAKRLKEMIDDEQALEIANAMNDLQDLIIQSGELYSRLLRIYKETGGNVSDFVKKHPVFDGEENHG